MVKKVIFDTPNTEKARISNHGGANVFGYDQTFRALLAWNFQERIFTKKERFSTGNGHKKVPV